MDAGQLLEDLRAEQADLAAMVQGADLRTPTPADPWDVGDTISHLRGTDLEARRAATDPEGFRASLAALAEGDGYAFLEQQVQEGRALGDRLLEDWQRRFEELLLALAHLPRGVTVPWYGPPMSPASFATARLMEYWAHGQDVADGLGVTRTPTDRLRHVVHLGVRTRGFSYVNRGLPVPEGDVRVEVVGPSGDTWTWGSGDDAVRGPALDLALLVTQRRHRSDLALETTGPLADSWLDVAQAFAGPPGPGRPPATATT